MGYTKLSLCMLLITITMTLTAAGHRGGGIHLHSSPEAGEYDTDQRPGNGHRNRNNRGRAVGHQKHGNAMGRTRFEEGLPDVYPIKGSPQAPLIMSSVPGRALGLQKQNFAFSSSPQQGLQYANSFQPEIRPATNSFQATQMSSSDVSQFTPQRQSTGQQMVHPVGNQHTDTVFPTKPQPLIVQQPPMSNQLFTPNKPAATTPSSANPRRVDLFYGSNLLEENKNPGDKVTNNVEVDFDDRGLFDSAPHCQSGQILVNNRCRMAV